jgi:hypothetical protein
MFSTHSCLNEGGDEQYGPQPADHIHRNIKSVSFCHRAEPVATGPVANWNMTG